MAGFGQEGVDMVNRERFDRMTALLDRSNLDAVFLAPSSDLKYIASLDMKPDSRLKGLLVTRKGEGFFLCPSLYRDDVEGIRDTLPIVEWKDGEGFRTVFQTGLKKLGIGADSRIAFTRGIEAGDMLDAMEGMDAACINGFFFLAPLRSVKSPEEQARMRHASRMNDAMMDALRAYLRPGLSETDVIRFVMNCHEAQGGVPRVPGVATGVNSARPHYARDNNRIIEEHDIVMIDSGGVYNGYNHDMTRTFFVGTPTDEQRKVYNIVLKAQSAAEEKVCIGAVPRDLDRTAREIIRDEGYGEAFNHRLGHGIGMDGHEAPFISEANSVPLVEGNCFSIEPGIYLKGKFGVRIENLVMLTASGKEVLNAFPKDIVII